MKNKMRSWGEGIWEAKIKAQNEIGVIHGGRFSNSKNISSKQLNRIMNYLEENVFPIIKKEGKIMDAGIGPLARFSIEFAKKGYNVLGVDVSPTTLKYAQKYIKKKGIGKIRLVKDDLTTMNNIKEKFDFIFCFGTFGHIPKILALETMKNFYSRLNKNGLCFVHFWMEKENSLKIRIKDMIYMVFHRISRIMHKSFYVNCSFYSMEELKDLFDYSGFKVINDGGEGLFLLKK